MRRAEREVTELNQLEEILRECQVVRIGAQDQEGLFVVPVNFGHAVEDGRHVFYFHGAGEGRKVDLIRQTGWACVEMDEGYQLHRAEAACGHSAAFRSIIAEGPVVILEDLEEKRHALALIMAHAAGSGDWEFPEAAARAVCVYKLTAEELSCKEHL